MDKGMKKRWISLYVENQVGVLSKISGLFAGKGHNVLVNSALDPDPSLFLYNSGKCRIFPFYRQHSLFFPVILTLDGLTVHDGKEPLSSGFSQDQFF